MSTGLELIPLGIFLIGALSRTIHERLEEASVSGALTLETRMVDVDILLEALSQNGIEYQQTEQEIHVTSEGSDLVFRRSARLNFHLVLSELNSDAAASALETIEQTYCGIFQENIAAQFTSNANSLGYPISREVTEDDTIRLRITVS